MAQLVKIDRQSDEVYEATLCSKIPSKYHKDFFGELIRQRGKIGASCFLLNEVYEGILLEAFSWRDSVKGIEFWSNLEEEMLTNAGILVVEKEDAVLDECFEKINNIKDKRSEELAAIHADMRKLLELLKQVQL